MTLGAAELLRGRAEALSLISELQARLVTALEGVAGSLDQPLAFEPVTWTRDGGRHGGGTRLQSGGNGVFDRASVNLSQVHYDDMPTRPLSSATALSAIVHPRHPRGPSLHTHVSWTALRDGRATWRLMADLNPSHPDEAQGATFQAMLQGRTGAWFSQGLAQGNRYFAIPALGRQRGQVHFYLEGHATGDTEADAALARTFGEGVIDTYGALLEEALAAAGPPTPQEQAAQLAYHTLYLYQVLTLDRGTTSGLLVHSDNDVGVLGSLPSQVDRQLLASWAPATPAPQDALVRQLALALPATSPSSVTPEVKGELARIVRQHYRAHPEATELLARGAVLPPTVANHGS